MTTFDKTSTAQKLRATLHRDVRAICTETCHFLGLEVTKPAMEIISELIFKKLLLYGCDLEAFAKHAKRTTVNSEDVKLLVRRNPSLKQHLNTIAPTNLVVSKDKRRKTVALPVAKQPDTPSTRVLPEEAREPDFVTNTKELENDNLIESNLDNDLLDNMIVDDTIDLTFD